MREGKRLKPGLLQSNPLGNRREMADVLGQLLAPLLPHYSEGKARLLPGSTGASYPDATAGLEGFSRVLWGLAPHAAGGNRGEVCDTLWEYVLEGIRNGTDPNHPEYWGFARDCDQKLVEMAAFGYAMALAPHRIWDRLAPREQDRLVEWLGQINRRTLYDCNWLLFQVMVSLGFKRVGIPYDRDVMERNLERIERFYLSDGWYSDGVDAHCDYYGPFAIHFYCLMYAVWMEKEDPERSRLYKQRAAEFAQEFLYWFAADGSALPYGRSLTYRFAQSAFWSALAFAGLEPVPMGVIKGIVLRNLRWWLAQPIFQGDGVLSIGYRYPNLVMAENYNAPGSPYWALKAFLPLAFGEDHPFWQSEEQPLPALETCKVQRPPRFILHRQEALNHVLAFHAGYGHTNEHTHTAAKYEKFVYSNRFGFSVPRAEWGLAQGAFDSTLALGEGDNLFRVKRKVEHCEIGDRVIHMRWKPWPDVEVATWIVTGTPWHVRIHRIHTARKLEAAEGGFALGIEPPVSDGEPWREERKEDRVLAMSSRGSSGAIRLVGEGSAEIVVPHANTNILHHRTVIPTVIQRFEPGIRWMATGVYGHPGMEGEAPDWDQPPTVEQREDHWLVRLNGREQRTFHIQFV